MVASRTGKAAQVVRDAAEIGYRHFDTAQAYANERWRWAKDAHVRGAHATSSS